MLTRRGFWCLIVLLVGLGIALASGLFSLLVLTSSLLVWFLSQWGLFWFRVRWGLPRLRIERTLRGSHGAVRTLWASQSVHVAGSIHSTSLLSVPYLLALDRVPPLGNVTQGDVHAQGGVSRDAPISWEYQLAPRGPGRLRFEGVRLLFADLQGFFTYTLFLREGLEIRVLPALVVDASHPSIVKQHNALPLLGTHRYARPGGGSELLELREYMPGDPPRTIAWKASARRDRLLTREFESEVPVRCTLFVDVSSAVRLGTPGRTALGRLVQIAAAVAQINNAERDLTGLCLFDESRVSLELRAGRGVKHLHRILHELTDIADLVPAGDRQWLAQQIPVAFGLAQDLYPDYLHHDVNAFPWFLPYWAPHPNWTLPVRLPPSRTWWEFLKNRWTAGFAWSHFWLTPGRGWRFSGTYHREYRRRKQLAAILSVRYNLGPGGLARLLEDDDAMGVMLNRFLQDHQVACPQPLYDEKGAYLFACPTKHEMLAQALLRAVRRAKDNEVFVLMVDALDAGAGLDRLEKAVGLARAKHHQVVVIQPWPSRVAMPGAPSKEVAWDKLGIEDFLLVACAEKMRQGYELLHRRLGRTGATVICAQAHDAPEKILAQMNKLRRLPSGGRS